MVKMLIVLGLVVAVLIVGGVLEVQVHPERLGQVPGKVISYVTQPSTQARARVLLTDLKRRGEQLLIKDEAKRTRLALLYVTQDAARLQEQLASGDPAQLLPQADLLADSIAGATTKLDRASLETISALKDESREAISAAQESLEALQREQEKYQSVQEKFAAVTAAIREHLEALRPGSLKPDVAGVKDEPPPTPPGDEPQINAVPLNF